MEIVENKKRRPREKNIWKKNKTRFPNHLFHDNREIPDLPIKTLTESKINIGHEVVKTKRAVLV